MVSTATLALLTASLTTRNLLREPRRNELANRVIQLIEDSDTFRSLVETDCFERQLVQVATICLIYFLNERQHWATRQLQKRCLKLPFERGRKFLRVRQHYVFRNNDINIRNSLSSCHLTTSQLGVISRPRRIKKSCQY